MLSPAYVCYENILPLNRWFNSSILMSPWMHIHSLVSAYTQNNKMTSFLVVNANVMITFDKNVLANY